MTPNCSVGRFKKHLCSAMNLRVQILNWIMEITCHEFFQNFLTTGSRWNRIFQNVWILTGNIQENSLKMKKIDFLSFKLTLNPMGLPGRRYQGLKTYNSSFFSWDIIFQVYRELQNGQKWSKQAIWTILKPHVQPKFWIR